MAEDCENPEVRRKNSRRLSIGDDENDDELAKEVSFLQQRGILPEDFPSDGGVDIKYDDDDLCKGLDELLQSGELTTEQVESIKQRQQQELDVRNEKMRARDTPDAARVEQIIPPFSSDGTPVNWYRNTSPSAFFSLIQLKKGDPEFDIIAIEFKAANIEVKKIERIQNKRLLERFKAEMEDIKRHHPPEFNLNARYLYHGTNVDKDRLCEEGLDQRLSRMGYFGKGIYFSDNPIKCVHYSTDPSNQNPDEACILKCRVILGDTKVYGPGCYDLRLQREPEKQNPSDGWRYYDSVMGCPKDYNEHVVYENRRAMIEYIISFKVDRKMADKLRNQSSTKAERRKSTENISNPDSLGEASALNGPLVSDEDHFKRISEVREAVRRKRLEESGKVYIPPSEEQMQHDRDMWARLQKVHGVKLDAQNIEGENSKKPPSLPLSKPSRRVPARGQDRRTNSEENQSQITSEAAESYKFEPAVLHSEQGDNPVEQVLSFGIAEFLAVTDIDDSSLAKYYVQKAEMDVNHAISLYYEDMA